MDKKPTPKYFLKKHRKEKTEKLGGFWDLNGFWKSLFPKKSTPMDEAWELIIKNRKTFYAELNKKINKRSKSCYDLSSKAIANALSNVKNSTDKKNFDDFLLALAKMKEEILNWDNRVVEYLVNLSKTEDCGSFEIIPSKSKLFIFIEDKLIEERKIKISMEIRQQSMAKPILKDVKDDDDLKNTDEIIQSEHTQAQPTVTDAKEFAKSELEKEETQKYAT